MQPETPSLPEYMVMPNRERYPGSMIRPILKLPQFLFAWTDQDPEYVPEESGAGRWLDVGEYDAADIDSGNSPQLHNNMRHTQAAGINTKNRTLSAMTPTAAVHTNGPRLPSFPLRSSNRNGTAPSQTVTNLPMQHLAIQDLMPIYGQQVPEEKQDVLSLKLPTASHVKLEKSPFPSVEMGAPRRAVLNNRFDSHQSIISGTSTLARLSQERRIYQSPLSIDLPAFSSSPPGTRTSKMIGARKETTRTRETSMLPREEQAQQQTNDGDDTGGYIPKLSTPVSINTNRPLLETLIVQNNAATNADEIRQRVEDVLMEIINSAVSKL